MKTLQEFGEAVIKIREAIESLEIKGANNAAVILYCNQQCNEIVRAINEACKTAPPGDVELDLTLTLEDPADIEEVPANGVDS